MPIKQLDNPATSVAIGVMDDELTPELREQIWEQCERDFRKRLEAFNDFAKMNPEATVAELVAYRRKICPPDPVKAEAFTNWCVLEVYKELNNE